MVSVKAVSRVIAPAVCVLVLGAAASPATADRPGPCASDKWFVSPPAPGDEAADHNGNGLICVRGVHGNGSSVFHGITVVDDHPEA